MHIFSHTLTHLLFQENLYKPTTGLYKIAPKSTASSIFEIVIRLSKLELENSKFDIPTPVLYLGQNFWGPSLAPSIIFRGPFGIFEGHELMEKKIQLKMDLQLHSILNTARLIHLHKIKTVSTIENVHLLVQQDEFHCSGRNSFS